MVRVDVEAVVELCSRVLPGMVERGRGAVLNVASVAAFQPLPGQAGYGGAKAFVLAYTDALHAELAGTGVTATSLCPGPVHTGFGEAAGHQPGGRRGRAAPVHVGDARGRRPGGHRGSRPWPLGRHPGRRQPRRRLRRTHPPQEPPGPDPRPPAPGPPRRPQPEGRGRRLAPGRSFRKPGWPPTRGRSARPRSVSLRWVQVDVPTKSARTTARSSSTAMPTSRDALPQRLRALDPRQHVGDGVDRRRSCGSTGRTGRAPSTRAPRPPRRRGRRTQSRKWTSKRAVVAVGHDVEPAGPPHRAGRERPGGRASASGSSASGSGAHRRGGRASARCRWPRPRRGSWRRSPSRRRGRVGRLEVLHRDACAWSSSGGAAWRSRRPGWRRCRSSSSRFSSVEPLRLARGLRRRARGPEAARGGHALQLGEPCVGVVDVQQVAVGAR